MVNINDALEMIKNIDIPADANTPPSIGQDHLPPHLRGLDLPDTIQLFPSLIEVYHWNPADNLELKNFILKYIDSHPDELHEVPNAYKLYTLFQHTGPNFFDLDEPIVQKFKKFLSKSYETSNTFYHWDLKPDHIIDCWVNITEKDGSQYKHNHSNSWLSGTYYLDFPENSSPIRFHDSKNYCAHPFLTCDIIEANPFNVEHLDLTPRESDLFLWRSHLKHETLPNQSDRRISISMNFLPKQITNGSYSINFS